MCKEGFRSVPIRNGLNETMPLIHPVVPTTAMTFFFAMYTANSKVTRLTPAERLSQGLPELRIKKRFFRGHDERRIIILARPRGIIVRGSFVLGVHPVRPVDVVASFVGFVQGFLDRH